MQPEKIQEQPVALKEKSIADDVLARVNQMREGNQLVVPESYAVENAFKSAYLQITTLKDKNMRPALSACTKESIANALLDMVVQGLSPAKQQCYFIVYGDQLQLQRSYFGTAAVLKRLAGVQDVFAQVIYADDEFEYRIDQGNKTIVKHEQKLANIDNAKIVGAYAVILRNGREFCEVMSKAQIETSWSKRKNDGKVQREFPEEMAKRTVINRAAKMFVNTSDDSDLLCEAINRSTQLEYGNEPAQLAEDYQNREPMQILPEPESKALPPPISPPPARVAQKDPVMIPNAEEAPF